MLVDHSHHHHLHNTQNPNNLRRSFGAGGMLSAMNSMNATERRERSGSPVGPALNDEPANVDRNDAVMSESVVSSSLPASYGGIIQNVPALDMDSKNLSSRIQ